MPAPWQSSEIASILARAHNQCIRLDNNDYQLHKNTFRFPSIINCNAIEGNPIGRYNEFCRFIAVNSFSYFSTRGNFLQFYML